MNLEQQRQQAQQAFVESGQNIEIGTLQGMPLTLQQLKNTTAESSYVVEVFNSGLTAVVYHLKIDGQHWTLKRKRKDCLVKNIDGQTSFLNEVQRRRDLVELKRGYPGSFKHIVDTQFASFRDGIILSPWVEGNPLAILNRNVFQQIFSSIVNLELRGLFEWDFCPGNILLNHQDEIRLFDFGYMYQFDPKKHFNSNGRSTPLFHGIERFETRFFFDFLLKNPLNLSPEALFELYKLEKQCALEAYQEKLQQLIEIGADVSVISRQQGINQRWRLALTREDSLRELYLVESFRSNVLDLLDDLHGQSCSPYTLKKADLVLGLINSHFELLRSSDAFFFGDETKGKNELITKYSSLRSEAEQYQLNKVG
ncbi:hypothetical protein MD588_13710 [Photobacterium sp. SDRW27]|uniref:hypothetical protein n=1 Tax=Photobacterium obscurum TaxID=2829490 RepID=UPI002242DC09|nr:hypothetical protein [Photobacterium obscurum]MCW8329863.1 hypothetical protein [Photobacterium obscurum]